MRTEIVRETVHRRAKASSVAERIVLAERELVPERLVLSERLLLAQRVILARAGSGRAGGHA